jgi:hypothetical protein
MKYDTNIRTIIIIRYSGDKKQIISTDRIAMILYESLKLLTLMICEKWRRMSKHYLNRYKHDPHVLQYSPVYECVMLCDQTGFSAITFLKPRWKDKYYVKNIAQLIIYWFRCSINSQKDNYKQVTSKDRNKTDTNKSKTWQLVSYRQ